MTVLDVGANVGAFALAARKRLGSEGKLVLLEPDRDNLRALERNASENGFEEALILPIAAGSTNGTGVLYRAQDCTGGHTTVESRSAAGAQAVTAKQRTIDSLADEHKFSPDFIKIDVEGAELEVLSGAQHTIHRCRPTVVIAAYHEPDHPDLITQFFAETVSDYRCTPRCVSYGAEREMVAAPIESPVATR